MSATTGLTATTPRQKEIKKLLGQGKNPQQIAKALGISDNAIHQQVRRMRGGKSAPKPSGGSTKRSQSRTAKKKSGSTGRKSARTRPAVSRPAPAAKPQTAEDLLKSEVVAAEESRGEAVALIASLKDQITEAEAAVVAHDEAIARKRDVLAVMTGEKVAHAKPAPPKPKPKAKAKASSDKGGASAKSNGSAATGQSEGTDGPQEPPQAAQTGDSPAAETPAPGSQAEREATADHDGGSPDPAPAAEEAAPATA